MTAPIRSQIPAAVILSRLDASQREAAQHNEGPSIVLCGAGGGKTSTITARVARLIVEGVSAERILCTTFSVAGAEEMRKRIAAILEVAPDAIRNTVSTFHSLALRLLTQERDRLPFKLQPNPVIESSKTKRLLREIVKVKERVGSTRQFIARMRRKLITPGEAFEYGDVFYVEAYRQYHDALCKEGQLDFDSMIYWAVKLLEQNAYVRAEWQGRFKQVIVDECHDTSDDQMRLAVLLSQPSGNLMRVGDPSQRIYGWRGASASALAQNDSKPYFLGINYRSCQEIIDVFVPLAEQDDLTKQLSARTRAITTVEGQVEMFDYFDEAEQASGTVEMIAKSIFDGAVPDKHAVLSRTRALLAQIADEFEYRGLPYRWSGKNFWLSNEVQDVLAFAKLAVNPKDEEAFSRIICCPAEFTKYLGQKFADAVIKSAKSRNVGLLDVRVPDGPWQGYRLARWESARMVLRGLLRANASPRSFLKQVLDETGLERGGDGEDPDDFKGENLQALTGRAARFNRLSDFLIHADVMSKRTSNKSGVTLSTIHGSKGLEWEVVHVIGVAEDVLPHRNTEDQEEERRVLYVGLSRARRKLVVSYHKKPSVLFTQIYKPWELRMSEKVIA